MLFTIYIKAPNDPTGNSRSGWLIYTNRGDFIRFVDDSGEGTHALYKSFSNGGERTHYFNQLASFRVNATTYNLAKAGKVPAI